MQTGMYIFQKAAGGGGVNKGTRKRWENIRKILDKKEFYEIRGEGARGVAEKRNEF